MKRQDIFADIGLANPEQELLKAQLALQIYSIVKERKLTQAQTGKFSASSSRMSRRCCAIAAGFFRSDG